MRVVIVGAGPAGLAAASYLGNSGIKVTIIERGKIHHHRDHNDANDLGVGIGGAGIFSDGKFSFYPSGTEVYKLNNQQYLLQGHQQICDELNSVGIESHSYQPSQLKQEDNCAFKLKDYPSTYGSLEQRKSLINNLASAPNCRFITNADVKKITKKNNHYVVQWADMHTQISSSMRADHVIIATGRLGNLEISTMLPELNVLHESLRYEIGIRIETTADIGFLSRKNNPDVKAIWKTDFGEIRTFCTCRDGEIWNIPYGNIAAISGRSDGPKSGYSNFGLLVRFTGNSFSEGSKYFNHILNTDLIKSKSVGWQPLESFLGKSVGMIDDNEVISRPWFPKNRFKQVELANILGTEMHSVFSGAISKLLEWSPDLYAPSTRVLFPLIEGTGMYPHLSNSLKIKGENIWCCGDLAGRFRGIIPAFLSGYYAAQDIVDCIESYNSFTEAKIVSQMA